MKMLLRVWWMVVCGCLSGETTLWAAEPPLPHWISSGNTSQTARLSRRFVVESGVQSASVRLSNDFCRAILLVNGEPLLTVDPYCQTQDLELTGALKRGQNEIALVLDKPCGPVAVALSLQVRPLTGPVQWVVTDAQWSSKEDNASKPKAAEDLGAVAPELWGIGRRPATISPFENYEQWQQSLGGKVTAQSRLWAAEGFDITLVRQAEANEGSWIAMAFDPKGRLTISREDQGFLRLSWDESRSTVTKVEAIASNLQECRGLLYDGETLFANANNSKGMYRLRISEEGKAEEVTLIREFPGGVGHGRNDLTFGEKGEIYSIHGDIVQFPGTPLRDRTSPFQNVPRQPAPTNGYVVRWDRPADQWDLLCKGLRNPYGIARNARNDLFTYDADNEFDMGLPWYRPTRMVQLVSGADYGWRLPANGFPGVIVDQPEFAPPLLHIGHGSPTSVIFGDQLRFPEPYRQALFVLDWSYGRILAVHLQPRGTTYRAAAELFAQGRPLNVTDLTAGPDGALYVTTGGRKTQSALYRIAARSFEPTLTAVDIHEKRCAEHSSEQHQRLESLTMLHGLPKREASVANEFVARLEDADPFLRGAAQTCLEQLPVESWREEVLSHEKPSTLLAGCLSLVRAARKDDVPLILNKLENLDPARDLALADQFVWLRILELCRLVHPEAVEARHEKIVGQLLGLAASKSLQQPTVSLVGNNAELRRRVALFFANWGSPEMIAWVEKSLLTSPVQEDVFAGLTAIRKHLKLATPEQRRAYFTAWVNSAGFLGGQGLPPFREFLKAEGIVAVPPAEQAELLAIIAVGNPPEEPLPPPRPLVKKWTLEELAPVITAEPLAGNPERGKILFKQALCIRCHRAGARGVAVGPELTNVARRFSRRDILESILTPSKTVAENYRNVVVETHAGQVYSGRVISEGDYRSQILKINTDPLRPQLTVEIDKRDVAESQVVETSPMPQGLLDSFTVEEIRDLLAFLESGAEM